MKKMLVPLLFCMFSSHATQLQKFFHHTLQSDQAAQAHIELAKLVFYFSDEPSIQLTDENAKSDMSKKIFFFPGVRFDEQVASLISALASNKNPLYHFTIPEGVD